MRSWCQWIAFLSFVLAFGCDSGQGNHESGQKSENVRQSKQDQKIEGKPALQIPPDMVLVPAGSFTMGCAGCPPVKLAFFRPSPQEGPPTEIELDAFAIESHEVTVGEFEACVENGACDSIDILGRSGRPHACSADHRTTRVNRDLLPVDCVKAEQAEQFCAWQGRRLPTEAEWEKAARGTDERRYPWGNEEPTCELAHFEGCPTPPLADLPPTSVGHFPTDATHIGTHPKGASPYGVEDMAGNVWEVTADDLHFFYFDEVGDGPQDPKIGRLGDSTAAARGGGFTHGPEMLYTFTRIPSYAPREGVGFRCALSIPEDVEVIEPKPEERRKTSVLPQHPEKQK